MRRTVLGLAAAVAFASGLAFVPQFAHADTLPAITQDNQDVQLYNADKVSVLVVVGTQCRSCAAVEDAAAKSAALHPEVAVSQVDQDLFVVDDEDLPELRVYVPGVGFIGTKKNVDASTVDAFLKARAEYAGKRAPAAAALKAAQDAKEAKLKPFKDKAQDVFNRGAAALDGDYKALQAAAKEFRQAKTQAESDAALKKPNELRADFQKKTKPYSDELKDLETQARAATVDEDQKVGVAERDLAALDQAEQEALTK